MNLDLKNQIDPLINLINKSENLNKDYELIEKLQEIVEVYLSRNKYDTEIWLFWALCAYRFRIDDTLKAEQCLEYILSYDVNNYKAALLLGYIKYYSSFTLNNEFYEKLCKIVPPTTQAAALIEYVKYLYYDFQQKPEAEHHLLQSIAYDSTLVKNNIHLARFYLWEQNNVVLYKKYFTNGFHNIMYVYRDDIIDPYFDAFNIDEFINELLKGIHVSSVNYQILKEDYENMLEVLKNHV